MYLYVRIFIHALLYIHLKARLTNLLRYLDRSPGIMELSYHIGGTFVPWKFRSQEPSFPAAFVPWDLRPEE